MKFVTVVGARPQFIKLAPISRALRAAGLDEIIVHTGQHYDENMSHAFFVELDIPKPDYNLEIGSGTHGAQTGKMLAAIEEVLERERPDGALVIGDTNSTLAGALAAVKLHIPVAHVEAGLRGFDRSIPEEINRLVTDHVSSRLYCSTERSVQWLRDEGITRGVELVGDVMYDLLLQMRPRIAERTPALLADMGVERGGYTVVTMHRPSNTDDPDTLRRIIGGLDRLGDLVIFPMHPRTRHSLARFGITPGDHLRIIEPLGYIDMLALMASAARVVTDSGGLQKETFLLGVPCITLRDRTEWLETVEVGWNTLVATDPDALLAAWRKPTPPMPTSNPFGKGNASQLIADDLRSLPDAL
ncbi:MAG TPA: UDP-N-acetylglucosamine 2-epimerase (non-hydrolyzing) [Ktedonobacterales bacterium]|jgi:UDP-N-acetylglucosamine 2-epimerase